MNEIIDGVYLGNQLDANYWNTSENGIGAVLDLRWLNIDLEVTEGTVSQVELAVKMLDVMYSSVIETKNILIHCMAGIDRSPFVLALWMSRRFDMTIRTAYDIVKEKRPETFQHWEWVSKFETD